MPFKEALFWIGITVFGAGLYLISDHRVLAVILIVLGLMGIAYSVLQHHHPELLKRLPLWLPLLLITWVAIGYDYYDRQHGANLWGTFDLEKWNRYQKTEVAHKTFTNDNVILDGKSFLDCTFENVTLTYNGTAPFNFEGNSKKGSVVIHSDNPALMGFLLLAQQVGGLKGLEIESTDTGKKYTSPPTR